MSTKFSRRTGEAWVLTLTEPVPEVFENKDSNSPDIFSRQTKEGNAKASEIGSVRLNARGICRCFCKRFL